MSEVRIKVTGITTPDDAAFAVDQGVDMLGCVFFSRSPRYVTPATASAIRRVIGRNVGLHGVFVDTPGPLVLRVFEQCALDGLQFFGNESREYVEAMGDHACKAVSVRSPEAVVDAQRRYVGRRPRKTSEAGLLLHLAGPIADNWHLAVPIADRLPLILASSALDARSVASAVSAGPWALDVWENVETEPGVLDRVRLKEFVTAVRAASA